MIKEIICKKEFWIGLIVGWILVIIHDLSLAIIIYSKIQGYS